jgi:HD-GYP domain-containing protein (c-di-GMP phosphodiesterase class II)
VNNVYDGYQDFDPRVPGAALLQAVMGMGEGILRTPEAIGRVADTAEQAHPDLGRVARTPLRWLSSLGPAADFLAHGQVGDTRAGGLSDVADWLSQGQDALTTNYAPFREASGHVADADIATKEALSGNLAPMGGVLTDPEAVTSFVAAAVPSLFAAWQSGGSLPLMSWLEAMQTANDAADFEQKTGETIEPEKFTQAMAQAAAVNGLLERIGLKGIKSSGAFKGGITEGVTEGLQSLNSNAAARWAYNPDRDYLNGVLSSAIGGFGTGAVMAPTSNENTYLQLASDEMDAYLPWKQVHELRTARLGRDLGTEVGLDSHATTELAKALMLHDQGFLEVPTEVANNPDNLTPQDWAQIRQHTDTGARIMKDAPGEMGEIARDVAQHHHDRLDANPSLNTEIAEVADVFESLTAQDRPYPRRPHAGDTIQPTGPNGSYRPGEALSLMLNEQGHYDPDILNTLVRMRLRDYAHEFSSEEKQYLRNYLSPIE